MRFINARNRAILSEMVRTDFKVRYQGSLLGYLWSLLKPLFFFAILYVVFTYIIPLGKGVEHFPVYLLLGVVIWNFFVESTTIATTSVVSKGDLMRKISIPRYLVVISSLFSAFINLMLSLIVVFLFALLNGIVPTTRWILFLPLLTELFVFSLGISFLLSALYVRFRDFIYIWEIALQAGFYATPIVYPIMTVPIIYQQYFYINPITQIIQDSRYIMVTKKTGTFWNTVSDPVIYIAPFAIILTICIIGGIYFKKKSKFFAEDI